MSNEASNQDHFIKRIIDEHIASGKWGAPGDRSVVRTRFPPEPNGYLHIGHAKSVTLNSGLAREYGGAFVLRFDDTNPSKEEQEFVDSILFDVHWLGGVWEGADAHDLHKGVRYASDYFEQMYEHAQELIRAGKAYVDEQPPEKIREQRGEPGKPGVNSPHRDRDPAESLDLFARMRAGEFADGAMVLRAKIDMASGNFNMRDPVMYRIQKRAHHRTGSAWPIYPMYDWAHGLEDSIEGITHSLCTLEFEDHRPLYDWFINEINGARAGENKPPIHHPQQIEFAKLLPGYTMLSKRNLRRMVEEGLVQGWDDPRMPTIGGMRRRGYTPEAIRRFCTDVGVSKFNSTIDIGRLENACRDHLNKVAPRRMVVLDPLKVVIENFPEGETRPALAQNNPEDAGAGEREVPFTREIFIERDDFMMDPPKKFYRLGPGREVRLRAACWITCTDVVTNDAGEVVELRATYDPQTWGGANPPPDADGNVRKVKGTLHWVSAEHAVRIRVRQYDRLFEQEHPAKVGEGEDWTNNLNADSLHEIEAMAEPSLVEEPSLLGEPSWPDGIRRVQFERHGYFCVDPDSTPGALVWNRTVSLKDSWAKVSG